MDPLPNNKHKIMPNDTSLIQPTIVKSTRKRKTYKKCNECNRRRKTLDESHQICHVCYNTKKIYKQSGNKIIDDFIKHVQINYVKQDGKMVFVPYDKFENVELIGEGGFSKIYKATWIDCQFTDRGTRSIQKNFKTVALKKLNNSKNITSKELNEVNIPH